MYCSQRVLGPSCSVSHLPVPKTPPHFCIGVYGSRVPCTLSRRNRGGPISIRGPCEHCHERRCRTHCKCGRRGELTGRSAARPAPSAQRRAAAAPPPPAPALDRAPPPRPVGRPAAASTVVLSGEAWWTQLLLDVRAASEVAVSSLVYDHPGLTAAFLEKLQAQGNFELVIVVFLFVRENFSAAWFIVLYGPFSWV